MQAHNDLQKKIDYLRRRFDTPESQATFDGWQKELEDIYAAKSISDNPLIRGMNERASRDIEAIETKLMRAYSNELPDKDRDSLLQRVEVLKWFRDHFLNLDEQVEEIEQEIDKAMIHYQKNYSSSFFLEEEKD